MLEDDCEQPWPLPDSLSNHVGWHMSAAFHGIIEWFELEGALKIISSNSPATGRDNFH